jgi:hypothetical protein
MPNDHEAAEAIAGLDGKELGGRNLWLANYYFAGDRHTMSLRGPLVYVVDFAT